MKYNYGKKFKIILKELLPLTHPSTIKVLKATVTKKVSSHIRFDGALGLSIDSAPYFFEGEGIKCKDEEGRLCTFMVQKIISDIDNGQYYLVI